MARVSPHTVKAVERLYNNHLGVRIVIWALLLVFAWMSCFEMGRNSLIDLEQAVRRDAAYERFELNVSGKKNRNETLIVYFQDGTQVETKMRTDFLMRSLRPLNAGTILGISTDPSGNVLLGLQHGDEILLEEEDTARRLNIIARIWMVMGAAVFVSVPVLIVREVWERGKKKKQK